MKGWGTWYYLVAVFELIGMYAVCTLRGKPALSARLRITRLPIAGDAAEERCA